MTPAEQTLIDARLGFIALVRAHHNGDEDALNSILSSADANPPALLAAGIDIVAAIVEATAHVEDLTVDQVLDATVRANVRKASWNCDEGPS